MTPASASNRHPHTTRRSPRSSLPPPRAADTAMSCPCLLPAVPVKNWEWTPPPVKGGRPESSLKGRVDVLGAMRLTKHLEEASARSHLPPAGPLPVRVNPSSVLPLSCGLSSRDQELGIARVAQSPRT